MRISIHPSLRCRATSASLICAVVAAALVPLAGDAQSLAERSSADEREVVAVDDACVVAEVAHDEAALRRMIDDRFVFNRDSGTTMGKEAFVQRVVKLPMVGQSIRERSVLVEGDIALVFATTDLRFASTPDAVSSFRHTCVYVRRGGQWRMLALQMQERTEK